MAEPLFINELLTKLLNGDVRIPSFQRGFVWDSERVAHLMDSIYKGFPFGSLLFWRTRTPLNTERNLGPYKLPDQDPDFPIDYVLDGQQRATSIFGVFQTSLQPEPGEDASIFDIYFDLTQESTVQDSNFIYVPPSEFDPERHFPLRYLFDPPAYRRFLRDMNDDIADTVDELYQRFTTARIPVQTFTTDDRTAVAIVFERINRLGVELDTLQLMSAWTWNEDFDLQDEFSSLAEELEPFGFRSVGEDSDLLLRCCSAVVTGEASPSAIINLSGEEVRDRFNEIRSGVLGAVDFLRASANVISAHVLPYPSIIIPLSVFFAAENDQETHPTAEQQEVLVKWVWRVFLSRRYSKRLEQLNYDIREIRKLRCGESSQLGNFDVDLSPEFFRSSQFNLNTLNTKTFVLLLASEGPLNFCSGAPVVLDDVLRNCNKREFHHIFPRRFLSSRGEERKRINCLSNFAVLSRADNNRLGGGAPSEYRGAMPANDEAVRLILSKALCPPDPFDDDFNRFLDARTDLLLDRARRLMGIEAPPGIPEA